jgi:glycogen(starch) synthase
VESLGTSSDRLRILHCSWEYPPIVYGGLGRHVDALTRAQVSAGHEVTVLTQSPEPSDRTVSGVRVIGRPPDAPHVPLDPEHLIAWSSGFNSALIRSGLHLLGSWRPDIVHGHDWLVAHACTALSEQAAAPYVTTMHATEAGRHQGWLPSSLSRSIHSIEWWSVDEADRVITCSAHMRQEVSTLFGTPPERISVIANGVDPVDWHALQARRRADRHAQGRPLVVFAGRLEWEKGVHTLIDAMGAVRKAHPGSPSVSSFARRPARYGTPSHA